MAPWDVMKSLNLFRSRSLVTLRICGLQDKMNFEICEFFKLYIFEAINFRDYRFFDLCKILNLLIRKFMKSINLILWFYLWTHLNFRFCIFCSVYAYQSISCCVNLRMYHIWTLIECESLNIKTLKY